MKTFRKLLAGSLVALISSGVAVAGPSPSFEVFANANSTSGGVGLDTISLSAGQQFTVSVSPDDLWNAGSIPRWSNANGLVTNLYYDAGTDSQVTGASIGDLIGQSFGNHTQGGLSAPYGTLVGQIGDGNFFSIGTKYTGTAVSAGSLKLYYFDFNNGDNSGSIIATVATIPEPETYAMLLAGLGLMGAIARRKKQAA